jgi:acyl-CoA synthetase (AMP-forming)/AMP-acid ligase II
MDIECMDEQKRYNALYNSALVDGKLLYAGNLLRRAARLFGNSIALVYKNRSISYAALYEHACRCAYTFQTQGIKPGDRILISLHNSIAYYAAYFGAWQSGAVVMPLNTFLVAHEIASIIADAKPAIVVTEQIRVDLFKTAEYGGTIYTDDDIERFAKQKETK